MIVFLASHMPEQTVRALNFNQRPPAETGLWGRPLEEVWAENRNRSLMRSIK